MLERQIYFNHTYFINVKMNKNCMLVLDVRAVAFLVLHKEGFRGKEISSRRGKKF